MEIRSVKRSTWTILESVTRSSMITNGLSGVQMDTEEKEKMKEKGEIKEKGKED